MAKDDLQKEIDEMISLRNEKRDIIDRTKQEVAALSKMISDKYKKLEHKKRYETIQVSDHAIIRWMERSEGVNFDAIRKEILTDRILKNILEIRDDGIYERRVVKNGVIVTVLDL